MDAKVTEEELSRLAYEECLAWLSGDGADEPVEQAFGEGAMAAWLHQSRKLAERDAQIAEMRKITGPKCPKCGHWLKAEHGRSFNPPTRQTNYYCKHRDGNERCECEFPVAELGLEANDGK